MKMLRQDGYIFFRQGKRKIIFFSLWTALAMSVSCSRPSSQSQFFSRVQSYPYHMSHVRQDQALGISGVLVQAQQKRQGGFSLDASVSDATHFVSVRDQWGELAPEDLSDHKVYALIDEALSIHVDPKQNGGLFYLTANQELLQNSQPQASVITMQVAQQLKIEVLRGTKAQGDFVLVEYSLLQRKYEEMSFRQALEFDKAVARQAIERDPEVVRAQMDGLLTEFESIRGLLPPSPYSQLFFLNGGLKGLDPHSGVQPAQDLSEVQEARGVQGKTQRPHVTLVNGGGRVVYVKIPVFTELSGKELHQQLIQAKPSSVILDLRGNPGGDLNAAWTVVQEFVVAQKPTLFWYLLSNLTLSTGQFTDQQFIKNASAPFLGPLVILVDRDSASASEIVAANLKHLGRAFVVGQTSFGKGSVQSVLSMEDESVSRVKKIPPFFFLVTTGLYFTALDYSPQFVGLSPNFLMAKENRSYFLSEQDLTGALRPRRGQAEFVWSPTAEMSEAQECLKSQQSQIQNRSQVLNAQTSATDIQILVAQVAIECLAKSLQR